MTMFTRARALAACAALTATGFAVAAPAGAAPADPVDSRPLAIAASWIEGQLTGGVLFNDQYTFNDYGLTIDAGLSLAAIGGHDAAVGEIADALAGQVGDNYAEGDEYEFSPPYDFVQRGHYAGQTAKALAFAQSAGKDPVTWAAGIDLVTATEARVITTGPSTGRISDDSSYGDYANVIGQAFAARGLAVASSSLASDAIGFLLEQQCSAGFFRLDFAADAGAADQSCDGGIAAQKSDPDTDATALVILQLLQVPSPNQAVTDAIAAAESWLLGAQRSDGSFGGGPTTEEPNTNSTGLAGWALGALGDSVAAGKAAGWVRGRQADEPAPCANALSGETGAIGYDGAAVAAGLADGITTGTQDQWRRATAPTLPVLQWAPAALGDLTLTGPTRYLKARGSASYRVTGGAPGDKVCLNTRGSRSRATLGANGARRVPLGTPWGTGTRAVSAKTSTGSDQVAIRVLGRVALRVRVTSRAEAGAMVTVRVHGLASGERVRVLYRGIRRGSGTAGPRGVYSVRFAVPAKTGPGSVVAYGEFASIRKGSHRLRVVG